MVRFLPELLSIITENALRPLYVKLKEEEPSYTPSKHFSSSLSSNPTAMHLACTYAVHLLEKRDMRSLTTFLPVVAQAFARSDLCDLPDVFLHLLVVHLTSGVEGLREAWLQALLREFWVPCCRCSEPALLHFCRLLWTLHPHVSERLLAQVLEGTRPQEHVSKLAG